MAGENSPTGSCPCHKEQLWKEGTTELTTAHSVAIFNCQGDVAEVVSEGQKGVMLGRFVRLSVIAWQKKGVGILHQASGAA